METIDFVLTWVDGDDPVWLTEKNKYLGLTDDAASSNDANSDCRYRADHELLRFWFRSVEQFAPWVRKIHFITCGQKPKWLNESHPKLNLVNHKDFIPERFLPTFNSNTIELNLHRLQGLSEHFVLFNDDMYLLKDVQPFYFFKDGKPVLMTDLRYPRYVGYNNWSRFLFNDYCILNKSFDMRKSIWDNRRKWFNFGELGFKRARQNFLCYIANKTLPVGIYGHLALPHYKSTIQRLWDKYPMEMDGTCASRFRSNEQVNQYLLCAWNQAEGNFHPVLGSKLGKLMEICPENIVWIRNTIVNQSYSQVCLNDSPINQDPVYCSNVIKEAFQRIVPVKSSFEK